MTMPSSPILGQPIAPPMRVATVCQLEKIVDHSRLVRLHDNRSRHVCERCWREEIGARTRAGDVSATIVACSILGNRKQRATGSFTSQGPSSQSSSSGGCFVCTFCEHTHKRQHGQRAKSRFFDGNAEIEPLDFLVETPSDMILRWQT